MNPIQMQQMLDKVGFTADKLNPKSTLEWHFANQYLLNPELVKLVDELSKDDQLSLALQMLRGITAVVANAPHEGY